MKQFLITTTLFLAFSSSILSQDAPNFTFTDTEGNVHRLYEDYLDKGTTVVLDVFFVGCPPCANIAPFMEELYQEWGAGAYDVEFIELSKKQSDSNSSVATWKSQLGLTYPGAGGSGGSHTAVKPYVDGEFGPFYGTPVFIVIGPDKQVQFDVTGAGAAGTMEALGNAIRATGAVGQGIDVRPTIFEFDIKDAFGNPVNDVNVTIASNNGIGASYDFPASDGDILSILNIEDQFPGVTDPTFFFSKEDSDDLTEKVSAIDLINILKHIINIDLIQNDYIVHAADANNDGYVSSLDILLLRRIILGLQNEYPAGGSQWKATPENVRLELLPDTSHEVEIRLVRTGDTNDF